jgi:hypothetical protein
MRRVMPYKVFIEWVAYLKAEAQRIKDWEYYAANLCRIATQNKNAKLKDFIMKRGAQAKKVSPADLLRRIAFATGAKIQPEK